MPKERILMGKILQDYMKSQGLKQVFISKQTGIPENTLSMMFTDKIKIDYDSLESICKVLKKSPEYFRRLAKSKQNNDCLL